MMVMMAIMSAGCGTQKEVPSEVQSSPVQPSPVQSSSAQAETAESPEEEKDPEQFSENGTSSKPTTEEEPDYLQEDLRLYEQELFTLPQLDEPAEGTSDFRQRPPVYENADDYEDAGFFDDSDTCWRQRKGQRNQERPQEQAPTPPTIDEGKLGDRLGNKLRNGLSDSLGIQIESAIDSIEKRVEKKADSKIAEVKASIRKAFDAWKWKVIFAIFALIVFGCICASLIAYGVVSLYRWLIGFDLLDWDEDEPNQPDSTNNVGSEKKGSTRKNDRLRRTKTKA